MAINKDSIVVYKEPIERMTLNKEAIDIEDDSKTTDKSSLTTSNGSVIRVSIVYDKES